MAMTFRGLEFCHRNWILHRASWSLSSMNHTLTLVSPGFEAQQFTHCFRWAAENC
jgi:hypothetical protein